MVWEKVLKIDRPYGRRVLRFNAPIARGLWWRLAPQYLASFHRKEVAPLGDEG